MTRSHPVSRLTLAAMAALLAAAALPGCAPLVVGGAMVGSALVVTDRRTTGTQIEDQAIELKGSARAREVSPSGHINVTSYNRQVLLTGEVPNDVDRRAVEQALKGIENVRSVTSELAIAGNSSLGSRSNDAVISGKVKASFVDAKDMQANAIKVVTERSTVYLMGMVTEREAGRAADLARSVSGVQKVVRVFEVISEEQLARMQPQPAR
jgi:osmotically-inducible protein OsmY